MIVTINQAIDKAIAAEKEGKLRMAIEIYREIINAYPGNPIANYNLGLILIKFGENEEALKFLRISVVEMPQNIRYLVTYIESLISLSRIVEAQAWLTEGVKQGLQGDQIDSLTRQLSPISKVKFFYEYLTAIGIFNSKDGEVLDGNDNYRPLLTTGFIDWFETQRWSKMKLLELGSGSSTIYFSNFFNSITSVETQKEWFERLRPKLTDVVNYSYTESILDYIENVINVNDFDVLLLDSGENRAKIARYLLKSNFKGIVFFDNSEWYRNSISLLLGNGYIEIPFFGIKPVEGWVSCTSVLIQSDRLHFAFNSNWKKLPGFCSTYPSNSWDCEYE